MMSSFDDGGPTLSTPPTALSGRGWGNGASFRRRGRRGRGWYVDAMGPALPVHLEIHGSLFLEALLLQGLEAPLGALCDR